MLKDITLGQYFPGNSVIHRLDPRTKLMCSGRIHGDAFRCLRLGMPTACCSLFLLTVIKISAIPGKSIVRGMKPLVMILVFTGVLNLFLTRTAGCWWISGALPSPPAARQRAAFMLVRILMLVTATFLLTYTTSPISLTDGLESLMNPLKKLSRCLCMSWP